MKCSLTHVAVLVLAPWLFGVRAALCAQLEIVWQTNAHFEVRSVAFSGDGLHLASGGEEGAAKVWAVSNRSLTVTIGTPAKVTSVALDPSASLLVTGGDDGATRVWSTEASTLLCGSSPNEQIVWSVDISPDGALVAIGKSWGRIDMAYVECVPGGRSFYGPGDVFSVAFSPDGTRLAAAGSGGSAMVWRISDGSLLYNLTGHSIFETNEDDIVVNAVYSVDFSPDGTLLATAGADDTTQLWRVADGVRVRVLTGTGGLASRFSADGKTLFTLDGAAIRFWRVADGRLLGTFENTGAQCLAVCPDGKYFAYGTGAGTLVLARMPLVVEIIRQDDQIILHWTGGSGLYRIQRRNDLTRGEWHNFEPPVTAMSFTNKISRDPVFYRVISLPNP